MQWAAIKEQAELYRRDTVNYPKRWFNEGKALLANLYTTACKEKTIQYADAKTDRIYNLPPDYKYVRKVVNTNYLRNEFKEFVVDPISKTIAFNVDGTFDLYYLVETADVVGNSSEVPEINSAYHYALAKYIAAKELEYIRDQRHKDLMTQFYADIDIANKSIKRGDIGPLKLPRRPFR